MIKYKCPKCGATLESESSMAGQEDQCPLCRNACLVPAPRKINRRALLALAGSAGVLVAATVVVLLVFGFGSDSPSSPSEKSSAHPPATQPAETAEARQTYRVVAVDMGPVIPPPDAIPALISTTDKRGLTPEEFLAQLPPPPKNPREIAARVSPSVVLLVMEDGSGQPLAMASGFVVLLQVGKVINRGIVATNMHVIEGAARGYAKRVDQKTKYDVLGVVASDPARDLVLLAVDGLTAPMLPLGDSEQVAVGDAIYAVGNPQGLEGTFSAGIVSSIRKVDDDSLLQITAPISPGSSGGPVVNSKGEVVGVAVATFKGGQNLNFAIPSRYLLPLLQAVKTPVALGEAAKSSKGKKEKSILDDMGGRSTEAVEGGSFTWDSYSASGFFSFSIKNKLRYPVKGILCLVVFYSTRNEPLDVTLVTIDKIIPPGLAKRVEGRVPDSVEKLNTPNDSLPPRQPKGRVELRVLYFDIVTGE